MNVYNNKTRILLILDLLKNKTDDEHVVKASELIECIQNEGLKCDRKTLYDDIKSLNDAGFDIIHEPGGGYKLVSREFEDAELRLLADAVYSSKFISAGKTKILTGKLKEQTSTYMASTMIRNIYSSDSKTPNEDVLYNVDTLSRAIQDDKKVEFEYLVWGADKKLITKGAKKRVLSPWSLIWQDQNYYLLAYDSDAGKMKHFRVDKMRQVTITDKKRKGKTKFSKQDKTKYNEQYFRMFGGEVETVTLKCRNEMANVIIDQFGKDVWIHPIDDEWFSVNVKVAVSDQFLGWVFALGGQVIIDGSDAVKDRMRELMEKTYL